MLLERFLWAKADEVTRLRQQERKGALPVPFSGQRGDFIAALQQREAGVPLTIVATVPFEWQSVRISSHGLDFKVPAKAGRVVFEVPPRSGTVQISKDR